MNNSLFHRYYEQQLNTMDINPTLRTALAERVVRPKKFHTMRKWLVATTATAVLAGSMYGLLFYVQPQPVTAAGLLQQALATPILQSEQIYQSSWTRTSTVVDATGKSTDTITKQTTISDGIGLERLAYNEQGQLVGAELALPQTDQRDIYDVYAYGSMRQFQADQDVNTIQHRLVYNVDVMKNVTSDDPSTFKNLPDGWTGSYGRTSVLELVAGSSVWRPYLTNDVKQNSFFVEPTVTEVELDGEPVYRLDVKEGMIEMLGWISKTDGRLLQEQTRLTDAFSSADMTTYSQPVITIGTLPSNPEAFIATLKLDNVTIKDFSYAAFQASSAPDIIVDDQGLPCSPDQGACAPVME